MRAPRRIFLPRSFSAIRHWSLAIAHCSLLPNAFAADSLFDKPDTGPKPIKVVSASASSAHPEYPASNVADGNASDASRWLSLTSGPPAWIEVTLSSVQELTGLHVVSGYMGKNILRDFVVQFWRDGAWVNVPSADVSGNKAPELVLAFDGTIPVVTDRVRLWITDPADRPATVREIRVWPASVGNVPPLPIKLDLLSPVSLYLNQSGFNAGAPKRFTAPHAADGTAFIIRPAAGGDPVFRGKIQSKIGDFTAFEPGDDRDYVIESTDGKTSVPFRVGAWWLERVTTQGSVDFMIDSRHYVGNDRRHCGGSFGWRDDHHFGWELQTLVPQWLSNPSAYARLPRQITYEDPTNPKLWGKLQPPAADAPDLVKLIHWGADVIVTRNLTHELMKSQLAYFLYAWPVLKDYLPAQNYEIVSDFAFANWASPAADRKYEYDESPEHDLLALKTKIGTTKGAYPPGFSVQPNLMMYEVAKREGRPDSDLYLDAAVRQAEWMIANLDWNDPQTTKGQRMSEFVTVTGLAQLLADYPDRAPAGLAKKLNDWAAVVIRRSDNLWDFRKYGDAPDQWTPMGDKPQKWNEVGNVVGLPAAIFAVKPFLTDPAAATRLEEIAWSHFDAMFGRNPTGRHFSFSGAREIEGVHYGWYIRLPGGLGRLENARFVLDGSAKNQHFPFHPEVGNVGWTEGWIQHNTPFNLSLAYLARSESELTVRRTGDELLVRLRAPLNFDYAKVETGVVMLVSSSGDRESVTVTEESTNSPYLSARVKLVSTSAAQPGDGLLQSKAGDTATVTYGFGYLGQRSQLDL